MRILTLQYRGSIAATLRFTDDALAEEAFVTAHRAMTADVPTLINGEGGCRTLVAPGALQIASIEDPALVTPPMVDFTKQFRRIEREAARQVEEFDENERRLRGETAGIA